jgi:hypothetical protein
VVKRGNEAVGGKAVEGKAAEGVSVVEGAEKDSRNSTAGHSQIYCGLDLLGQGDALICGTQGNAAIHEPWWNGTKATVMYADGRTVKLEAPFLHGGLYHEIEHFCGLVRSGACESSVVSHARSREVMLMLDRAKWWPLW